MWCVSVHYQQWQEYAQSDDIEHMALFLGEFGKSHDMHYSWDQTAIAHGTYLYLGEFYACCCFAHVIDF